jgi:hypothetical protein
MNSCFFIPSPRPAVVFICVLNNGEYTNWTRQFIKGYENNVPGCDHDSVVVFNNGQPSDADREQFRFLPHLRFFEHDNSGWDIGAYIAVSRTLGNPWAVYFGCTSFVQHPNWLERMRQSYEKYGPGFYGSLATYEISPHINTTGFWCPPPWVADYPVKVNGKPERYAFEHGREALWKMVDADGLPAKLVTWDGEYDWRQWRVPPDIYRRGSQSNCVTFFRHSMNFAFADAQQRAYMSSLADTLTDHEYLNRRNMPGGGNQ